MECSCGYSFTANRDSEPPDGYKSFAVIDDANFQTFIGLEAEILESIARQDDEETVLGATAKASKYVGLIYDCPECPRIFLIRPGGETPTETYKREE